MPPSQLRVLLDVRGLLLHCYHAGTDRRPFKSGDSVTHTAAHGLNNFIEMYLKAVFDVTAPINVIAVWEGGNSRRRVLYPDYKKRPSQEDESPLMRMQTDLLFSSAKKLLAGLGVLQVHCPTVEADDTLAYLCERLEGPKLVHTVDQDLLQLACYPDTEVLVKLKSVREYKGTPLWMVAMHKSIVGDTSDGYPGVPGIGEARFVSLLEHVGADGIQELEHCVAYGDYSAIEEALKEEDHPILRKLYENRDQWRLSYMLARLHPEWCEYSFGEKLVKPVWYKRLPDESRVIQALTEAGLTSTMPAQLQRFMPTQAGLDADTPINEPGIRKALLKTPVVGFDYESYDSLKHPDYQKARAGYVDVFSQKVTGASYCYGDNLQHTVYASLLHRDTKNMSEDQFLSLMELMLGDRTPVAHNAKFEQVLSKTNFSVEFDTMFDTVVLASYVHEETEQGLKQLSKRYLNYDQTNYSQVVPAGKDMKDVSLPEVLKYGCDDAFVTAHLFVLLRTICECEGTWEFVKNYETDFDPVFLDSFIRGIPVDLDYLQTLEAEDSILYEKTENDVRTLLTEHCSEHNKEGFSQLWEDLKEFYTVSFLEKMADKDSEDKEGGLKTLLEEKKAELWERVRYQPQLPPSELFEDFGKKALSLASKSVGLPGIRVTVPAKIVSWCEGLHQQTEGGELAFSPEQESFVELLHHVASACVERGVPTVFLDSSLKEACKEIIYANKELYIGDELNMDSPKQVAELIYGKMGLPILIRNEDKTGGTLRTRFDMEGAPGTGEIAIKTLLAEMGEDDTPEEQQSWKARVLNGILTMRGVNTRRELYYRPYPLLAHPEDGRIRPSIKNCGTKTRRPSSSTPNILQVSKKDGALIRGAFLPLPDDVAGEPQLLVSIDFVQQELVILAGESGDTNLRACYTGKEKLDVHSSTAAALLDLSYEEFLQRYKDKDPKATLYRKKHAKIVNFLTSYGGSATGLARKAVVPKSQAEEFLRAFFDRYPKVKEYQNRMETLALRHGFVKDCFGNRRHCDAAFSDNNRQQSAMARQAGNFPIQGGAASVLKVAMSKVRKSKLLEQTGATLYAPIYDEVVASVPVSKVEEYIRGMESCMEMELPGLNISLCTSVSLGRDWKEASLNELGEHPSSEVIAQAIENLV